MSEERQSDEIIKGLEDQIKLLIKRIDSQDLLLKAQNNKLNKLLTLLSEGNFSNKKDSKQDSKVIMSVPEKPVKKLDNIIKVKEEVKTDIVLKQEDPEQFKSPEDEIFTVSQRVLNKNGKAMYMVAVQITTIDDNKIVARPVTKGNGIWVAKLMAGKYRLKYSQQINLNSEKLEKTSDIIVKENQKLEDFTLA